MRLLSFKDAIREAQEVCLEDKTVFLIGEGVPDPKAIFGTTAGLKDKFPNQVFDMPLSENGLTGVCVGAAMNGMKPILVHQRIDFSLYSMDQIVNSAAKIHSMYGGKINCPMVIRMIVGRGWGAGNQHSQNLTAMFAHVPGLKIFFPTNARDAYYLFIEAVLDPNPVLFIEHRWLYETTSDMDMDNKTPSFDNPDVTIIAIGHAVLEAKKAIESNKHVKINLIELQRIKPLDFNVYGDKFIVVDDAWSFCGLAAEIGLSLYEEGAEKVVRVTCPDYPSGSSLALTKSYYPSANSIAKALEDICREPMAYSPVRDNHDVPDASFRGPF